MRDTGSRLAILPPHLARLFGGCTFIVPQGLIGPRSAVAISAHATRLLAAGILLACWQAGGSRCVRLATGRLWPEQIPAEQVDGAVWPIDHPDAGELLVATVLGGARYLGWAAAVSTATRELGAEGRA